MYPDGDVSSTATTFGSAGSGQGGAWGRTNQGILAQGPFGEAFPDDTNGFQGQAVASWRGTFTDPAYQGSCLRLNVRIRAQATSGTGDFDVTLYSDGATSDGTRTILPGTTITNYTEIYEISKTAAQLANLELKIDFKDDTFNDRIMEIEIEAVIPSSSSSCSSSSCSSSSSFSSSCSSSTPSVSSSSSSSSSCDSAFSSSSSSSSCSSCTPGNFAFIFPDGDDVVEFQRFPSGAPFTNFSRVNDWQSTTVDNSYNRAAVSNEQDQYTFGDPGDPGSNYVEFIVWVRMRSQTGDSQDIDIYLEDEDGQIGSRWDLSFSNTSFQNFSQSFVVERTPAKAATLEVRWDTNVHSPAGDGIDCSAMRIVCIACGASSSSSSSSSCSSS